MSAERVVAEACFSSNSALFGATTVCPNGGTSQTGNGAGAPCAASGCNHGTHVAGIAAGENPSRAGVAPDAPIIAIQVFSRFTDQPGNPNRQNCVNSGLASPCALTFRSDQIRGLQQVLTLSSTTQIASVNMSLGGGRNTTACDTDLRKPLIDQLRTAGIVTVIASGNDGFTDAVGAPGCISTAVTVGSTTKQDNISGFSNSAMLVDLLAPGSSINSSVPGNGFAQMSGTSMATPHVAGAFAALETAVTNKTLDEIQASLIAKGRPITDGRNNVTKPRIDLIATLNDLRPTLQISLVNLDPAKRLRDGATTTMRATATQGGNPVVGRVVSFSSSNTSRATVAPASTPTNASGVAEATVTSHTSWSQSNVTITATVDGVSDTAPVKVPDLSTVGFALLLLALLVAGLLRRRGRAV